MTRHVTVGGIRFLVTDDFNPDDPTEIAALRELADYVTARAPRMTPEQEQRQAAARDRIRTRNARLRQEQRPPDG